MKDIKLIIIGFLLATCMLLFMGQASNEMYVTTTNNGKYQVSTAYSGHPNGSGDLLQTIINTETGEVISRERVRSKTFK